MASSDDFTHVVVFDLETRRLAQEVGGWDALRRGEGGISSLVIWDNTTARHHLYDAHTLVDAANHLECADVVLSFNGIEFDIRVLEGAVKRRVPIGQHLDLLQLIWRSPPGRRKGNTLDEVASRTLNESKIQKSVMAPQLADEGRWGELFDYCLHDVELTRRLFKFAQTTGGVVGFDGQLLDLNLPPWFADLELGLEPKKD
jgi:hypothetical protein